VNLKFSLIFNIIFWKSLGAKCCVLEHICPFRQIFFFSNIFKSIPIGIPEMKWRPFFYYLANFAFHCMSQAKFVFWWWIFATLRYVFFLNFFAKLDELYNEGVVIIILISIIHGLEIFFFSKKKLNLVFIFPLKLWGFFGSCFISIQMKLLSLVSFGWGPSFPTLHNLDGWSCYR